MATVLLSWLLFEARAVVVSTWTLAEKALNTWLSWRWTTSQEQLLVILAAVLLFIAGPILTAALSLAWRGLKLLFLEPTQPRVVRRTQVTPSTRAPPPVQSWVPRAVSRRAWNDAAEAWQSQPPPPDLSALRPLIAKLKKELDELAADREARIRAAAVIEPTDIQLARHLSGLRIEDAKLSSIGSARCVVLRSWGIDTAADIDEAKIAEIPGFGKSLTDKLVIWKEMQSREFVPSTSAVVDPLEVQRIDRQLATRRTKLMKELREKIAEVERAMKPYLSERARLWSEVEKAHTMRR